MDDQTITNRAIKEKNIEKLFKLIPDSLPEQIQYALKQSVEDLSTVEADLDKLQDYISKVHSNDLNIQYLGLNRCRKLLNNSQLALPREQLIEILLQNNFLITTLQIALNNKVQLLQYEALWIIYNIVCLTQQEMKNIFDNNAINILLLVHDSQIDEIIELGICILAKISGESVQFRNMLLQKGIVEQLLKLAPCYQLNNPDIFTSILWAMANLGKQKHILKKVHFSKKLTQILSEILLSVQDESQILYACWGLYYLSDNDDGQQYFSLKPPVIQKLTLLLNSQNESFITPALKTIGNILTGNEEQTAQVLNTGVLKVFEMLLTQNYSQVIQREVCWSLSNIVAGTPAQVDQILKNDSLLKSLFKQFQQGEAQIFKEMSYFLSNLISYTDLNSIGHFLTQYDCFQKMSIMLDINDETIRRIILEGILEFSKKIQYNAKLQEYKQLMENSKIIDKVKIIQNNVANDLSEQAIEILQTLDQEEFV
ncbi:unnamed protein product (macronuclear) [Paramecium tetraurelia]|uniref:Importin subunit alpha n=1 Tax=Paramecium tetraurelia TaxID=5888 RepID=A0CB91_PARTE|nr:uncharacterized protein GSPATT00036841001 [Paramecium tetraurelia]CAK68058.1 unnamed protein product [Paramecium tetraurelia]|eukprot:XP_001435455.1 hypothetical protein (macronuclear) [Paramecium tetraurelia strain d4-2]